MNSSEKESGKTGEQTIIKGPNDVQFGDSELMKNCMCGDYACRICGNEDYEDTVKQDEEEAQGITAERTMNPPLILDFASMMERKAIRDALFNVMDDTLPPMIAEEFARLDEIPKPIVCPGCGVKLDEDCISVVDGTYHFGEGGCADQAGEPGKEFFPIEFELQGKKSTRQGVCQGTDPMDAIKNFLAEYPTSGDCGAIVAIRVPGVDTGGLA